MVNAASTKDLLLTWLRHHLDAETYEGLRWSSRGTRIFYVYWMHKAADPWTPKQVEVCEAWAKHKGNSKKNPRDIKANFRCALRSKKELKLISKTKDRLYWQIIGGETENGGASNVPRDKNNSENCATMSSSVSSLSDEEIAGPSTSFKNSVDSCSSKKRKYTKPPLSKPRQSNKGRKKGVAKNKALSLSEMPSTITTQQTSIFSELQSAHDSQISLSQMSSGLHFSSENSAHQHHMSSFQRASLTKETERTSPFPTILSHTDIQPASPFQGIRPSVTVAQRMSPVQGIPSIVDNHRTSPFQRIPTTYDLQQTSPFQEISSIKEDQETSPFKGKQHITGPQRVSPLQEVPTMMDSRLPSSLSEMTSTINLEQLSDITTSIFLSGEQKPNEPLPSFQTLCHLNRLTPPQQSTDIFAYGQDLTFPLQERCSWKSSTDGSPFFYQNAKEQDPQRLPSVNTHCMSSFPSANEEQLVPSTSPINSDFSFFDNTNFDSSAKNYHENQLSSPMNETILDYFNEDRFPSQDSQYVENLEMALDEFFNFSSILTPMCEFGDA